MTTYDVIVVGLGAMGSSVLRSLAARGARVLGLDRHESPHAHGSSHGRARGIREAYFEHPMYVPLVRRAYRHWESLERESGVRLLYSSRGAFVGARDSELVSGVLASAEIHEIPVEILDGEALKRALPSFAPHSDVVAVIEPRAGYLRPSRCVAALLEGARRGGAEVRTEEVREWRREGTGMRVTTSAAAYGADALVIAAGPWLPGLLGGFDLPLTVERVLQLAFAPAEPEACAPGVLPAFAWEFEPERIFYGFPAIDGAVKVGLHHGAPVASPEAADREVTEAEVEEVRSHLRRFLPAADGPLVEAEVCFYTKTPDGHFVVDWHPEAERALILSACSGHGFKFAPAIGEIVADLVVDGQTDFDLHPFSLDRLSA